MAKGVCEQNYPNKNKNEKKKPKTEIMSQFKIKTKNINKAEKIIPLYDRTSV